LEVGRRPRGRLPCVRDELFKGPRVIARTPVHAAARAARGSCGWPGRGRRSRASRRRAGGAARCR